MEYNIKECLNDFESGKPLIVLDDEDRENEGDIIIAAQHITSDQLTFMIRHTTGIICVPITNDKANSLGLHHMVTDNTDSHGTAFTITCDDVDAGTGVSSIDRLKTIKTILHGNDGSRLRKPGHIFPLVAKDGGIRERRGHTEASIDLCKLSGLRPVAVIAELQSHETGMMLRRDDCLKFGKEHNIKVLTIRQLEQYMDTLNDRIGIGQEVLSLHPFNRDLSLKGGKDKMFLSSESTIPVTKNEKDLGIWTIQVYERSDGVSHCLLIKNKQDIEKKVPYIRIHSECFTGHIMGSSLCDCLDQADKSFHLINDYGCGIFMYYGGHEGRGIGLSNKVRCYELQQRNGLDTYEANKSIGMEEDTRTYGDADLILKYLGVQKCILLSSNPHKITSLTHLVKNVINIPVTPNKHNSKYLLDKENKNKHLLSQLKVDIREDKSYPKFMDRVYEFDTKKRIGILRTMWNSELVDILVGNIRKGLDGNDTIEVVEVEVPGCFEIIYKCQQMAKSGDYDIIICCGIVIKGDTYHFELISDSVTSSLVRISLDECIPIVNGILSCYNVQQAQVRCFDIEHSKSLSQTTLHMLSS